MLKRLAALFSSALIVCAVTLSIVRPLTAAAQSTTDLQALQNIITELYDGMQANNLSEHLDKIVSPDNTNLRDRLAKIDETLNVSDFAITCPPDGIQAQATAGESTNEVRVECNFYIKAYVSKDTGPNPLFAGTYSLSGIKTYFVFTRAAEYWYVEGGDQWYITDTDFDQKISPQSSADALGKIFLYVVGLGLIGLANFIFALWMLIDAVKRPIAHKVLWVLLIIFVNPLGALIYFFTQRRKALQTTQQLSKAKWGCALLIILVLAGIVTTSIGIVLVYQLKEANQIDNATANTNRVTTNTTPEPTTTVTNESAIQPVAPIKAMAVDTENVLAKLQAAGYAMKTQPLYIVSDTTTYLNAIDDQQNSITFILNGDKVTGISTVTVSEHSDFIKTIIQAVQPDATEAVSWFEQAVQSSTQEEIYSDQTTISGITYAFYNATTTVNDQATSLMNLSMMAANVQ